ncbi:phosphoglycolate phosphatase [Asticcacaulis sp. EMRT-3]|uniref:phosphoglycolate phosphatase n=1 Tax=Asticcacaulis sp. EMRT-3 TaxID=3040349 RepID=UPI0024AF288B|nr:phosphoglycolate phosphatase [Asticcacaulis sp. EMRT-3]MDI7774330.1 phosphoglycolate phosphatase [Asticcacaulis sp. EMRT-3]
MANLKVSTKMNLSGYSLAFDLDGTLVDSAPDIISALNKVLHEQGVEPYKLDDARPLIGRGAMELLRRAFALAGAPLAPEQEGPLLELMLKHYERHIDELTRPYDGMEAALDALEAAGARFCVCTNKHTYLAVELLTRMGLAGRFGAIKGADTVPNKKPSPDHLIAAVSEMGGDMNRVIMIGDSETDHMTARNAKVPSILFTHGYSERPLAELRPDALLDHFRDLPAAVARLVSTIS